MNPRGLILEIFPLADFKIVFILGESFSSILILKFGFRGAKVKNLRN